MQFDFYFKYFLKNTPKIDKIFITITFIKSKAFFWIAFDLQKYLNKNIYIIETYNGNKQIIKIFKYINFKDYKKFKKCIYAIFGLINKKLIAKSII